MCGRLNTLQLSTNNHPSRLGVRHHSSSSSSSLPGKVEYNVYIEYIFAQQSPVPSPHTGSLLEYASDSAYVTLPMESEDQVLMIPIRELEVHPSASPATVPSDAPMEGEEEESEGTSTEEWSMSPLHLKEETPVEGIKLMRVFWRNSLSLGPQ